ncbi:FGGY-family carbohydrate kinase [Mollicutes bacterium LVI A0078]|nr:FGGY-family carbohydrate kinase [Mollicutes bacterium LVI A0075]WOO91891.1 FGGY-family carbohydrate kinase [Mollicutes bacterium LVI A0078]
MSLGTSGVVFAATDEYVLDKEGTLHAFCDATGKFHKMGVALNSGGSMNWWTSNVLHSREFEQMEVAMNELDPAEQLYYLPYLIGERSPINDSEIRGSFIGLSLHHSDVHMTRAVIEGVAFSIRQIYDGMMLSGDPQFKITGGGANNKLWVQIIADVIGKPINLINSSEGPAFGAAIIAYANHTNSDVSEVASNAVKVVDTIYPSTNSKLYMDKYQKWLQIYPTIKNIKL